MLLKERIKQEFGTEIIDNDKFGNRQLEIIWEIMSQVPKKFYCLHKIFAKSVQGFEQRPFWICIFSTQVGQPCNQFPNELTQKLSDHFSIVFVHELNHQVHKYYIEPNKSLSERQSHLINVAGTDRLQYLRGHIKEMQDSEGTYFLKNPQEFFASISNQWFSSSFITLKLALSRFEKGKHEPINQFLFFTDIYSLGEKHTRFYRLDVKGNIQRRLVTLSRNQNRHIESMIIGKTTYRFSLDKDGDVLKVKC